MEIEYLIITKRDEGFCSNVDSFLNLLSVDTSLKINIEEKTIEDLSNKCLVNFKINFYDNDNRNELIFDLSLQGENNTVIEHFNTLGRKIRKIVSKINSDLKINTIINDVGKNYAINAYPILFNIENLLRRLIYRFMYINVGMQWNSNAISDDVKKSIDSKNRNTDGNYLHNIDFIQLSHLLFQQYTNIPIQTFQNKLLETKDVTKFDLNTLEDIKPKSNWERYFSRLINIEDKDLKDKWEKLYMLRNMVPHNNFIERKHYDEIVSISSKITKILNEALEKLSDIKLTDEEVIAIKNSVDDNNSYKMNLLKAAKMLNIGISTAVEFLNKNGYNVVARPSTKLSYEEGLCLFREFGEIKKYEKEITKEVQKLPVLSDGRILDMYKVYDFLK